MSYLRAQAVVRGTRGVHTKATGQASAVLPLLIAMLCSGALGTDAQAQQTEPLPEEAGSPAPGTRVRVSSTAIDRTWIGRLERVDRDTLVVHAEDPDTTIVLPVTQVGRLEVSSGTRSRLGRGPWMGAAIGTATGAAATLAVCAGNEECSGQDGGITLAVLTAGGAVLGTLVGGVVGAMSRTERWELVSLRGAPWGSLLGRRSWRSRCDQSSRDVGWPRTERERVTRAEVA